MKQENAHKRLRPMRTIIVAGALLTGLSALVWIWRAALELPGTILATSANAGDLAHTIAPPTAHGDLAGTHSEAAAPDSTEEASSTTATPVFQDNPLSSLAAALQEKQAELDRKEKEIADAETRLEALRREIEDSLKRIESVRNEMSKLAGEAAVKRKQELGAWVKIYQSMKPEETAQIMAGLEKDFVLNLLDTMGAKKSSKVLRAMVQLDKGKALDPRKTLQEQISSGKTRGQRKRRILAAVPRVFIFFSSLGFDGMAVSARVTGFVAVWWDISRSPVWLPCLGIP